jgi:rhodanese-related sulfurtransferase
MEPDQFASAAKTALIVDTRSVEAYSTAHIRGSLHIQFRDSFAVWLGWLVPEGTRLLFVAEPAMLDDIVTEALLVGYEDFGGWLDGGVDAWRKSGRAVSSTEFADGNTARAYVAGGADLLDVRETNEYVHRHAPGAQHVALGTLGDQSFAGKEHDRVVVYCGHGERSSTAASLLERSGRTHIVNVRGGLDALLTGETGASR